MRGTFPGRVLALRASFPRAVAQHRKASAPGRWQQLRLGQVGVKGAGPAGLVRAASGSTCLGHVDTTAASVYEMFRWQFTTVPFFESQEHQEHEIYYIVKVN